MKLIKPYLLISIVFIGTGSVSAQSTSDSQRSLHQDNVYGWQGKLTRVYGKTIKETPVFLQYKAYDSIPGRYHKQLLVGELKNTKTKEHHPLIGFIQNQEDASYHFYSIAEDGQVERTILTVADDARIEGYLMRPGGDGYNTVLQLHRKDTTILPTPMRTDSDKIFGDYQYDFGSRLPEGQLSIHKNQDGTVNFSISSREKDGGGHVEVKRDSIKISGTSFTFDAKVKGVVIWSAKVQFYKGFAVVGFIKPNADSGKFGERSTIEGIFIKVN